MKTWTNVLIEMSGSIGSSTFSHGIVFTTVTATSALFNDVSLIFSGELTKQTSSVMAGIIFQGNVIDDFRDWEMYNSEFVVSGVLAGSNGITDGVRFENNAHLPPPSPMIWQNVTLSVNATVGSSGTFTGVKLNDGLFSKMDNLHVEVSPTYGGEASNGFEMSSNFGNGHITNSFIYVGNSGSTTLSSTFFNVTFSDVEFHGGNIFFSPVDMSYCSGDLYLRTSGPPSSGKFAMYLQWDIDFSDLAVDIDVDGGGLVWDESGSVRGVQFDTVVFTDSSIKLNVLYSMATSGGDTSGIHWLSPSITNSVLSGTWNVTGPVTASTSEGTGIYIEGGSTVNSNFTSVVMHVSSLINGGPTVSGVVFKNHDFTGSMWTECDVIVTGTLSSTSDSFGIRFKDNNDFSRMRMDQVNLIFSGSILISGSGPDYSSGCRWEGEHGFDGFSG